MFLYLVKSQRFQYQQPSIFAFLQTSEISEVLYRLSYHKTWSEGRGAEVDVVVGACVAVRRKVVCLLEALRCRSETAVIQNNTVKRIT